ncbi:MAG: UDP-N-acetylmuramoyl-tripeptide--D-alanyl-D-alanine ligase [Nitrospirae bacterium]|nr:UDP-N-acetylmuramoyl-tripeptide--D-alanyl-D-alanine ligase [Nitrospirota bacterium]
MMLSARKILEATGGSIATADREGPITADMLPDDIFFEGLSIDSRTIREGELFLALKGDRFDGHDFVQAALKTGAGAIVSPGKPVGPVTGKIIIFVDDTLAALHRISRSLRQSFTGSVIAVIGSNGKTTTKELIASILGVKLKVLKTSGNLNNHIGMPLSITKAHDDTEVMVLEMGTNRPGDIKELCAIGLPEKGVITNIGQEHLEGFGSMSSVRDSELELLDYVKELIANADDNFLMEGIENRFKGRIITFGIESHTAEIRAEETELLDRSARFVLCAGKGRILIESGLAGRFNIYNSLAAAAAAYSMGFDLETIKKGLESFRGVPLRMEVFEKGGVAYINDSYNANPSSMEESVMELARRAGQAQGAGRAIAVLGDMLELGDYSADEHRKLGRLLTAMHVNVLIGVGPLMSLALETFQGTGIAADSSREAGGELEKLLRAGDIVLVKGSRGMKMENAIGGRN